MASNSPQLVARATCQSAMRRWTVKPVSIDDCHAWRRSMYAFAQRAPDAERLGHALGVLGPEHATAVAHQDLRRAVLSDGGIQHQHDGGQSLTAREGTGHHGAAEVLQHRAAIELAVVERVVEVAD